MKLIYLDSSDISIFADARSESSIKTYNHLLNKCELGEYFAPISAYHISECAHVELAYRDAAVRRARVLKALSGELAFIFPTTLWTMEWVSILKTGNILRKESAISKTGQWFPPLNYIPGQILRAFETELKSSLDKLPMNRHSRRALRADILKRKPISNGLTTMLLDNLAFNMEQFESEIPLVGKLKDPKLLFDFLTGNISEQKLNEEFALVVSDVELIVGWAIDYYESGRTVPKWIRDGGREMLVHFQTLRQKIDELSTVCPFPQSMGTAEDFILREIDITGRFRSNLLLKIFARETNVAQKYNIARSRWEKVASSELGTLPSFDAALIAFEEYLRISVLQTKFPRTLRTSDLGDILHISYLPYVDIFRGDSFASQVAQHVAKRFGANVLDSNRKIDLL